MSEAKQRKLWRAGAHDRLSAAFAAVGVDTSSFGFYDQPAFLAQEERDKSYLEKYAEWVATRPIDPAYEAHARATVPKLAELVAGALAADDFQGSCVTAYSLITRMLDRLDVWSFGVIGSANLHVPSLGVTRSLHTIDVLDSPDRVLGHAWVCAPPFTIVDASLALQHWGGTPMAGRVSPVVLAEASAPTIRPSVEDCASIEVRAEFAARDGRRDPNLHHRLSPGLAAIGSRFPAQEVTGHDLVVRYVPVAIRQTDCPLERVNASGRKGRSGAMLWKDVVAPAFAR